MFIFQMNTAVLSCSLTSVGSEGPEADEWGLPVKQTLPRLMRTPPIESTPLSFLHWHNTARKSLPPMECQQQTGGVLLLNKGGSSLFHSLQAKLGSRAKILEETLVTRAEAWKRPDGNLTLQSEHGGRKSGIRVFFTWFRCETLALMAAIKAGYFVSEDTLQLSSVCSFHHLNLCTWDAKAIYRLSACQQGGV